MDDGDKLQPRLDSVALEHAVLCADCEVISNSGGETCEICGSRSLLSLGRVLGGGLGSDRAKLVEVTPESLRDGFTVLVNAGANMSLQPWRRRRNGSREQTGTSLLP
jgi:hypothetical protein